jgi:TnpA family transposase
MPIEILTSTQRAEWERFPEEIDEAALTAFFSFADDELVQIAARRGVHGRFAIAVAVGALRWLGFVPAALEELPEPAAALIASQLDVELSAIAPARLRAARRARGEHVAQAMAIGAFRPCRDSDLDALRAWLADRALGHDGPLALLGGAVDRLRREQVIRPGLTVLERLVGAARSDGEQEIHRRIAPVLTPGLDAALDELLVVPADATAAPVKLLGQETRSIGRIGESIAKLELLRGLGAETWDLEVIPANRRRMLAQYVRHATSQAVGRRDRAFRHPALLAFCAEAAACVTDEIVDLFDDGVATQHAKARRALAKLKLDVADSANASVVLLGELLEVLLDPQIPDRQVRQAVWQRATPEELQLALELAAEIERPLEHNHVEQLGERYRAARDFAPPILATLRLRANPDGEPLLAAVELLRDLNRRGARRVPDDAPVGFVPRSWRPYVHLPDGGIDRHHWELCLLSELRGALRAGEIWVEGSRRYTDPERFLISRADWPSARPAVLRELELPHSAEQRLEQLLERTARHRDALDGDLEGGDADVTIGEQGNVSVKRLRGEPREPDVDDLAREVANQLPVIDLPDLLIEVDRWTGFTRHLTHAGGATPRRGDHARHLFAAIISQACNLGTGRMARASDLSPAQVGWTSEWYLRHETLERATGAVVDHQATIALAQHMGTGEHSSSDGKRRIVSPDSQQARALPRYFGRGRGLTHYTFVSDQHTHFATRVIRTTVRDATYVLDGILDNRSQLAIRTHSTDTAGYSDIVFALFDLLGLRFAPRLAGLSDTRLWRTGPGHDSPAGRLQRHRVKPDLIRGQWDQLLRLAGSLDRGTVTASLLVGRLHAQQRRSTLAAALQDYGRLVKTEFLLRYLTRPPERRGIHRQLNKHESITALEDAVFYGNEGRIRLQTLDRQSTQAAALGLVSSAIVTWNTHHMNEIIERERAAGRSLDDVDLARLSAALHAHINLNGRYHIDPDQPPRHLTPGRDSLATYQ